MRSWPVRIGLLFLLIAVIAVTAWSLRYFGRYQPFADLMQENQSGMMNRIGLEVSDATIVGRVRGQRRWQVHARSMALSRDRRYLVVNSIHDGILYDSASRPTILLNAGRAVYLTDFGVLSNAVAHGELRMDQGIHATIVGHWGPTLSTEGLVWNIGRNTIESHGRVTAVFPHNTGVATGENIQFDPKTGNLSLHHLHGTFRVSETLH